MTTCKIRYECPKIGDAEWFFVFSCKRLGDSFINCLWEIILPKKRKKCLVSMKQISFTKMYAM